MDECLAGRLESEASVFVSESGALEAPLHARVQSSALPERHLPESHASRSER